MHGVKYLKKYLTQPQLKQVITSYLFSSLYYGAEIWVHRGLSFHFKRMVRSVHYKALRILHGNHSRDTLDQLSERASPDEWVNYGVAKLAMMCILNQASSRLLIAKSCQERRQPGKMFFYDTSLRKIGKQCISNRLTQLLRCAKFDWLLSPSKDFLRRNLKSLFFKYYRPMS